MKWKILLLSLIFYQWLANYNLQAPDQYYQDALAQWNYATNVTTTNQNIQAQADAQFAAFELQAANNASTFSLNQISDPLVKRQISKIKVVGINLSQADNIQLSTLISTMTKIYNSNPICAWTNGQKNCSIKWALDPDIFNVLATSRDYDELAYVWEAWRNISRQMKPFYAQFVPLSNKGARQGGFADTGAYWRSWYETKNFEPQIQQLYYQILPLYEELHTYVRRQLRWMYPGKVPRFTIPAHLLGNMWAQEWENIFPDTQPFPGKAAIDVTQEMQRQGYTPMKMFQTADNFFQSLGLIPMPPAFWSGSIITKPKNRIFVCHASAWDFYNNHNYSIKMCTDVDMNDLITIHHEMGHIQYYLQYSGQPVTFKNGANPGFHEAIGDTMALSVSTPKHLQTIGLLKNYTADAQQDLNYLYKMALEKIAFLPFAYMMDYYRWRVFDGSYKPDQWNTAWWTLRTQLQGLHPPSPRPPGSFDPAAKSHIDSNTPYIRYFVSFIVQFQFYKAMCAAAGYPSSKPLHQCDFYQSKAAGTLLHNMLKLGSSQPWPYAMNVITGQKLMDASAIMQYFDPLIKWLRQQNKQAGDCYGWGYTWPQSVMGTLQGPRCGTGTATNVEKYLNQYNKVASAAFYADTVANWNYNVNLTDYNAKLVVAADARFAMFQQTQAALAKKYNLSTVYQYGLRRQLKKISTVGIVLDQAQTKTLSTTINAMVNVYSTGQVCAINQNTMQQNCNTKYSLTDLSNILAFSRNYNLLQYVWKGWRDAVGPPVRQLYQQYVQLSNQGAVNGGFQDTGDFWRSWYEDPSFQQEVANLWQQLLPLYEQLHTYVRSQLLKQYPSRFQSSAIPAHILGNMWAQTWTNLYSFTTPYPNKTSIDVTAEMKRQGYTPIKMFHTSDDFFQSLGLIKMPPAFWNKSMFVQPSDGRPVVCHASAWDFYNAHDYRIKMCTQVTMEDLVTIHHEMGHVEYYLQYSKQPVIFRDGANPGFHEAIGDTMALSVSTPGHLKAIGLLPNYKPDPQQDINFLYRQALDKIAFLPFGYIVDLWRWNVFNGTYNIYNWNQGWWNLRNQYQGIVPPVSRMSTDFDPGAKFHIPNNMPYIRYFVSFVVQFQFYQSLCKASGFTGPLYQCDFYKSQAAGKQLAAMLKLGSSRPWQDVIQQITGQRQMSAQALMTYFQPLMQWLQTQNQGQCFGWGYQWPSNYNLTQPRCNVTMPNPTQQAKLWLIQYNKQASVVYNKRVYTDWTWEKNITDHNQKIADAAATASKLFDNKEAAIARKFPINQITDYGTARQLNKISGVSILLSANNTQKFTTLVSNMTNIFSTAYICNISVPNCRSLPDNQGKWVRDPILTDILATSSNYDLMAYIWSAWRNATGRVVLPLYNQYVQLGNLGAKQAGFQDLGDAWRSTYEDPTFKQDIENLWQQILPLYEQIHTFVRTKLSNMYPGRFSTSAIPAHITGNMWAQEWNNLYQRTAPYPNVPTVDVTNSMRQQKYTQMRMFLTAQSFFTSIGLFNMTSSFWKLSLIKHPVNRTNVVCYASAEDFYNGKDFAIKMCTKITMEDLVTIHHEMGHIEYFMAYSKQPIKFRDSANAGFHEAIGDTIALSVSTPGHLNKIGLLSNHDYQPNNMQQNINFLYKQALEKIAFLPFGYLIDNYRWKVFDGTIPMNKLNDGWWALRYKYQGLVPPVSRTNQDFDPGAKFHVDDNVPYIRYFVSFVVQFQFHKALCAAAGYTGPLYTCDIYQSKAAGQRLLNMLNLGSSQKWPYAMHVITQNTTKMDAGPLMEYFAPLMKWLKDQNTQSKSCYGWGYSWPKYYNLPTPRCPATFAPPTQMSTSPSTGPAPTVAPAKNYTAILIAAVVLIAVCVVLIIIVLVVLIFIRKSMTKKSSSVHNSPGNDRAMATKM